MNDNTTIASAHVQRITILTDLKRYDDALVEIQEALAFAPQIKDQNIRTYYYEHCFYGYTDILRFQKKLDQAIHIAHQGLALVPDALSIRYSLINTYVDINKQKHIADCKELLAFIQQKEPMSVSTLKAEIRVLEFEQLFAKNKEMFRAQIEAAENKVLEIDPHDRDTLINKTNRLIQVGKYAQARKEYKSLLESNPEDILFLENYAVTLLHARQKNQAVEIFIDVLTRHPNDDFARQQLRKYYVHRQGFHRGLVWNILFVPLYLGYTVTHIAIKSNKKTLFGNMSLSLVLFLQVVICIAIFTPSQFSPADYWVRASLYICISYVVGRYLQKNITRSVDARFEQFLNTQIENRSQKLV